jgi:hypothetical protein
VCFLKRIKDGFWHCEIYTLVEVDITEVGVDIAITAVLGGGVVMIQVEVCLLLLLEESFMLQMNLVVLFLHFSERTLERFTVRCGTIVLSRRSIIVLSSIFFFYVT